MDEGAQRWWLDDAERQSRTHPDSFFIPARERRESLVVGDQVKLVFLFSPPTEASGERMWVDVVDVADGRYVGELRNEPRYIAALTTGSRVEFAPEHVASIAVDEEEVGFDVEAWAAVSRRIFEGAWPTFVYRNPPEIRDLETRDSGWQLWAREDDDAYVSQPENVIVWELGWIADKFPVIEPLLASDEEKGEWWWDADREAYLRRA
jgi:hypothetical protein